MDGWMMNGWRHWRWWRVKRRWDDKKKDGVGEKWRREVRERRKHKNQRNVLKRRDNKDLNVVESGEPWDGTNPASPPVQLLLPSTQAARCSAALSALAATPSPRSEPPHPSTVLTSYLALIRYWAMLMLAGGPVIVTWRAAEPSVALAILMWAPETWRISLILLPCLPIMQPMN